MWLHAHIHMCMGRDGEITLGLFTGDRSYLYRANPYKENVCLTMAFKVYFRLTTSGRIFSVLPCDYSLITYVGKTKNN